MTPRRVLALELLLIVGLPAILLLPHFDPQLALGYGVDVPGTLWFHDWLWHCLVTATDPSWSPWFFWPDGKDIFSHTGNNFVDAAVALPFRGIFGSPRHLVPFALCLLVGNALAMRWLLRTLGLGTVAALVGALVFQLGPFAITELDWGRPTQAMIWWWPLGLGFLWRAMQGGAWRDAVLAGLFLALQAWTYWFTGHFFLLCFALPLAVFAARQGAQAFTRLVAAGAATVLFVLPGVVPMLGALSRGEVPGANGVLEGSELVNRASLDLSVSLVQPHVGELMLGPLHLALLALGLLASRRRSLWIPIALLGALLSNGPTLHLGSWEPANPLWSLAEHLPGFPRLLFPYRAWVVVALVGAVALAEALERVPGRARVALGAVVVVLGSVLIHDGIRVFRHTALPVPSYVEVVRDNPGVVLDLPFLCADEVMHLQPKHGSPLVGGMAEHITSLRPPDVVPRLDANPTLNLVSSLSGGRQRKRPVARQATPIQVRWVVLHKSIYREGMPRRCWSAPRVQDRAAWARTAIVKVLGEPTVEDERAAAWEIEGWTAESWNQAPGRR